MNECLIGVGPRQIMNRGCQHREYRMMSRNFILKGNRKRNKPVERQTAKEQSPL